MFVSTEEPAINTQIESPNESDESADEDDIRLVPAVEESKDRLKARHILGILGFLGFANVYAMRVNLSVAIVAMVNHTAFPSPNSSNNTLDHCPVPIVTNTTNVTKPIDGPFAWDESTQGIVLGSFFYGYVLTQVPGGRLAELFGGKLIFGLGVLLSAVFTLLSPIAVESNFYFFIIVRILEGMAEGVTYPAMHAMFAKWIPPLERSKFGAYVYAGSAFGTVISLPLSGWLCSITFMGGWPLAFYIFGILGIVWFIFWLLFAFNSPASHPRISREELSFLRASIEPDEHSSKDSVPWLSMAKCLPLWAILVTQCGQSWLFYTLLTELPTYMSEILHFDIQQNALLTAIPNLTNWLYGIVNSIFAEWLLSKGYLSLSTSNKVFNSVASIVPALGLLGVAWLGCDWLSIQIVLATTGAFGGAAYAGNAMNHISLSPRYAGTMFGITNCAANFCGFLAPYVVGSIISGKETLGQWAFVFYLAAGISMGTNLFYLAFASAREQPWSKPARHNDNALN